jgi:hypothetical protein
MTKRTERGPRTQEENLRGVDLVHLVEPRLTAIHWPQTYCSTGATLSDFMVG